MARAEVMPDPFAAAEVIAPATSKDKGKIYVAGDVKDAGGNITFTGPVVADALENYCRGKSQIDEGTTMMNSNRPIIEAFARYSWCTEWAVMGQLPENPDLVASQSGGARVNYAFVNRPINLDNKDIKVLEKVVGSSNIDSCVARKQEFKLNAEIMSQEIEITTTVGKKTEKVKDTVMNHLARGIQEKFKEHPHIIAKLFTKKPVQQTAPNLITRGVQLVCPNDRSPAAAHRLIEFLEAAKISQAIKAIGASGE